MIVVRVRAHASCQKYCCGFLLLRKKNPNKKGIYETLKFVFFYSFQKQPTRAHNKFSHTLSNFIIMREYIDDFKLRFFFWQNTRAGDATNIFGLFQPIVDCASKIFTSNFGEDLNNRLAVGKINTKKKHYKKY